MKINELLESLNEVKSKYGNVEICLSSDDEGNYIRPVDSDYSISYYYDDEMFMPESEEDEILIEEEGLKKVLILFPGY